MTSRNLFALAVLAAAGALLAGQVRQLLADPGVWPPDDFVEYWAAAKLTLDGQNPYEESLLLPLQRAAGRDTQDAIMMWNPPWALPAVLPLGLLPARAAQLLWLLVHLTATWFCADRLWLLFGGSRQRRWVSWAVALVFMPTVFALSSGQISPFLLLGAVLFLECDRRGWQFLAGAATVLIAIKPHLAYLLWVGLLVDALARGRWRVIVGGAVTGLIGAVLPLAFNPQVWHQYADAMANRPPAQWLSPTLGTVLRLAFGAELFRLQFVSVAGGLLWFAWYRWHHRNKWNWTDQLPLVLLVSFVSAPYGAWPFDMVLLLPAIFKMLLDSIRSIAPARGAESTHPTTVASWGGKRSRDPLENPSDLAEAENDNGSSGSASGQAGCRGGAYAIIAGLVAVNLGCLAMNLCQTGSFWFLWVSPAVLVLYAVHMRLTQRVHPAREPLAVAVPA